MPKHQEIKPNIFQRALNMIPLLVIRFYRAFISPLFPPSCRFVPSCSAYGLKAFQTYPLPKAIGLTVWRIMRCNPFNPGGYDPLAPPKTRRRRAVQMGLIENRNWKPDPH